MWAMIPMLRTRSRPILVTVAIALPPVVRKGLVGLCHPVDVVLALVRATLLVERVHDLVGELVAHALLAAVAGVRDDPADRQRARAALRHLDRNLIVGATDTAALDLEHRRDRLHGPLPHPAGRPAGLPAGYFQRLLD